MANYLRQGCEDVFIEDSAEIEYAKFNNLRHTVMGYMLGDFDEHGVYTVDEEIVKELIGLKKQIIDEIDNMIICQSALTLNSHITFLISFDEDQATLSLLEKVNHEGNFKENAGSYSDISEYILDRIETSGVITDRSYIYNRWNITDEELPALSIHDLDEETLQSLFGIVNRFKYLLYCNTYLLEKEQQLEEQELTYAEEIKTLLIAYPELKKKVDETLKETLADKKELICLDKPFVTSQINEVIERAIEENIEVLTEEDQKNFKEEKHTIQNRHNLHMLDILPINIVKPVYNAENSVGRVVVDTLLAVSQVVSNVVNNKQTQVEENLDQQTNTALKLEELSLKELQQTKDNQRQIVDERTIKAYLDFRAGRKVTQVDDKEQTPEQTNINKLKRMQQIVGGTAVTQNASRQTKEAAEETTAKKSETATNSLVGKAAAKTAYATKVAATTAEKPTASKGNATSTKSAAKKPAAKTPVKGTTNDANPTSSKKGEEKTTAYRVAKTTNEKNTTTMMPQDNDEDKKLVKNTVNNAEVEKREPEQVVARKIDLSKIRGVEQKKQDIDNPEQQSKSIKRSINVRRQQLNKERENEEIENVNSHSL